MKRPLFALTIFMAFLVPGFGQFKNGMSEAPGSWINATIGIGKEGDGTTKVAALKGIALRVGEKGEAAVAYDLELCRMAGAWTGKFVTPMNLMSRGEFPTALGAVAFINNAIPGFISGDSCKDPRPEPFGPLPAGEAKFKGFHVCGDVVVLVWEVQGTEILEQATHIRSSNVDRFVRTFSIEPTKTRLRIPLCVAQPGSVGTFPAAGLNVQEIDGTFYLEIPPHEQRLVDAVEILVSPDAGAIRELVASLETSHLTGDPASWLTRKHVRWPESVETQGELAVPPVAGKIESAYVVDTIKLPELNPWGAPMFVGGFDFFPDGRVAFCTFHGDVFIGSGIDDTLAHVKWKRFASGLYHALGLKIVDGEIYVTGRDGITRLRDLNGDGEADYYEAFNHDIMVTRSFHEFVFDLQTDPEGNFYFAKAGPVKNGGRGFDQIVAHHGCLFQVSADGKKLETVATGFRAPNGIGCSPTGQVTSGDNEGTWTPACRLNWIKPGGFYGVVDLAHRNPAPADYDRPLCWIPKRLDNSSGGQVWVTSDKWGPWKDQLLHLSYGTCALFGVLNEEVDGKRQGGLVQFPVKFQTGIMRARFNPVDGQLYVGGLRGWQTTGLKNGALQRVRYTGAQVRMPIAMQVKKNGIELTFSTELDTQAAADPENYSIEVWNYLWSKAYGSPEISTLSDEVKPDETGKSGTPEFSKAQMSRTQHDPLSVVAVNIGTNDRTVFLEIPGIKPVMQMAIKYNLKSVDGAEMRGEIVNTIHSLGQE
ncbi:MAG: putative large, multifunctional secreted protein [Chthoniobacteraceae bacterium]|nr:putative large, multifunctional secreted protein [Chthoniobacteraceae bacterium]